MYTEHGRALWGVPPAMIKDGFSGLERNRCCYARPKTEKSTKDILALDYTDSRT